jgi:drug/metabolite transporter (DMT)-like permease
VNLRGNMFGATAIFLFALGFPAADQLLQTWGIITLISLRNFLALMVMVFLIFLLERNVAFRKLPWLKGFWIGGIGFGFGSLLLLIAQAMTDATTAALAAAAMPIIAVGLEVALDGRRLSGRFLVAVALVLFGGALAAGLIPGKSSIGTGFALGLLASGIFAWGSRETVKSFPTLSPLSRTAITTSGMFGFTAIASFAAMIFEHSWSAVGSLDISNIVLLFIYACLALGISQVFWIKAVDEVGIGIASFHLNATPFYVMIIVFILGSEWNWIQTVGAAVLTFGTLLAQLPEKSSNLGKARQI